MVALAVVSCARRTEVTHSPVPSQPPTALSRQVRNAVDAGDGDLQIRALRTLLDRDPKQLGVRLDLAARFRETGYPDLAIEHLRLAAERFPESPEAELALVRLLRETGQTDEAARRMPAFLERAKPKDKPAGECYTWLGIVLDEKGELPAAEKAFREAVKRRPGVDSAHNNLGYNLLLQGKHAEAVVEFRRALELKPRSEIARNNLGIALAYSNSREAVLNWQSVSDPATAHNNLAAVLIEQGKYAEARKELELALGYRAGHAAALRNLALVAELDGGAASVPVKPSSNGWRRVSRALRKVFVKDDEAVTPGTVEIVSK